MRKKKAVVLPEKTRLRWHREDGDGWGDATNRNGEIVLPFKVVRENGVVKRKPSKSREKAFAISDSSEYQWVVLSVFNCRHTLRREQFLITLCHARYGGEL